MPHAARWRCLLLLGHRWEWIDSHPYDLGRGYETALEYHRCARCGALRQAPGSVLLPKPPRPPRGGWDAERAARPWQED